MLKVNIENDERSQNVQQKVNPQDIVLWKRDYD